MSVALWLDHVSVAVADLREAVESLGARLGLRATVTAADPGRHARVYLDRGYLEVSVRLPTGSWSLPDFFLRFDDPEGLRSHLASSGLGWRFGSYLGVDGRWEDVEVETGTVPLPILVRRTHPPEVAADWPPALVEPHRCGARTLEEVHLAVPDMAAALDAYTRLLGRHAVSAVGRAGSRGAAFVLAAGRIVLSEGAGSGVAGLVLGVSSVDQTARVVGPLSGRRPGWADPAATHGLRIGFTEAHQRT